MFHQLVRSPERCDSQHWTPVYSQALHRDGRGSGTRATLYCFSRAMGKELDKNWSSWTQTAAIRDTSITGGDVILRAEVLCCKKKFLIST